MGKRKIKILLLFSVALILVVSCIKPVFPDELFLQHITTLLLLAILIFITVKNNLSNKSFLCIVLMLTIHIIGARWIYSNVPYDDWINSLVGFSVNKYFNFKRNHYDRFAHFMYGILMIIPFSELYSRWFKVSWKQSSHIAFLLVLATSMFYELLEYLVAVVLSPEHADAYNGQQGDIWDAQKDMALALFGASIMTLIRALFPKRNNKDIF
jgi:putative membrane protein